MNSKINVGDRCSHGVKHPDTKTPIQLMGRVTHRINGRVVLVQQNAIHANLFTYLRNSLDSNVNKAIDDLMTNDEVAPGGAQNGKDGIAVFDDTASGWLSMNMSTQTPDETYGKKWRGEITVSQARGITDVAIGHSYQAGSPPFDTVFATQSFSELALMSGATYTVDWEIFIIEPE